MQNKFKVIKINGQKHVLVSVDRKVTSTMAQGRTVLTFTDQPNYRMTGMALCGILKPYQTIEQFAAKYKPVGNPPTPKKRRA